MSDMFGNHIVGFPMRRLICSFHFFRIVEGGRGWDLRFAHLFIMVSIDPVGVTS